MNKMKKSIRVLFSFLPALVLMCLGGLSAVLSKDRALNPTYADESYTLYTEQFDYTPIQRTESGVVYTYSSADYFGGNQPTVSRFYLTKTISTSGESYTVSFDFYFYVHIVDSSKNFGLKFDGVPYRTISYSLTSITSDVTNFGCDLVQFFIYDVNQLGHSCKGQFNFKLIVGDNTYYVGQSYNMTFYNGVAVTYSNYTNTIDFNYANYEIFDLTRTVTSLEEAYDAGFADGYNGGYSDGYSKGYANGEKKGYDSGFNAGVESQAEQITFAYNEGYRVGYDEGFSADVTAATIFSGILQIGMLPVNILLAIFNFEILGINLSAFVSAILTVCLTIIVIRTISGQKE